jgi:hypothetical protein
MHLKKSEIRFPYQLYLLQRINRIWDLAIANASEEIRNKVSISVIPFADDKWLENNLVKHHMLCLEMKKDWLKDKGRVKWTEEDKEHVKWDIKMSEEILYLIKILLLMVANYSHWMVVNLHGWWRSFIF